MALQLGAFEERLEMKETTSQEPASMSGLKAWEGDYDGSGQQGCGFSGACPHAS